MRWIVGFLLTVLAPEISYLYTLNRIWLGPRTCLSTVLRRELSTLARNGTTNIRFCRQERDYTYALWLYSSPHFGMCAMLVCVSMYAYVYVCVCVYVCM